MPPCPTIHETEPKLMMAPAFAAFMSGSTACAAKNWCFRLTAMRSSQYSGVIFFRRMPLVMGGVVDEDIDRSVGLARVSDAGAQRGDIGEVDIQKVRAETLARELARKASSFLGLDVEEHDNGFLLREAPHDRFADARCAAGDENDFAGEIRIDGGHDFLPNDVRAALYMS